MAPSAPGTRLASFSRETREKADGSCASVARRRRARDRSRHLSFSTRHRGSASTRPGGNRSTRVVAPPPPGGAGHEALRSVGAKGVAPVIRHRRGVRDCGAKTRTATLGTRDTGLSAFDRDRAGSLADEGGASAATVEARSEELLEDGGRRDRGGQGSRLGAILLAAGAFGILAGWSLVRRRRRA